MDHFDFLSLDEDCEQRLRPARPQVARLASREPAPGLDATSSLEDSAGGFDDRASVRSW